MRGVFHFLKKYQQEDTPMRPHWDAKIQLLKDIWGSIDEMETGPTGTAHLQVTLGRLPPKEQLRV